MTGKGTRPSEGHESNLADHANDFWMQVAARQRELGADLSREDTEDGDVGC
jgi:hypothetical protein